MRPPSYQETVGGAAQLDSVDSRESWVACTGVWTWWLSRARDDSKDSAESSFNRTLQRSGSDAAASSASFRTQLQLS